MADVEMASDDEVSKESILKSSRARRHEVYRKKSSMNVKREVVEALELSELENDFEQAAEQMAKYGAKKLESPKS